MTDLPRQLLIHALADFLDLAHELDAVNAATAAVADLLQIDLADQLMLASQR